MSLGKIRGVALALMSALAVGGMSVSGVSAQTTERLSLPAMLRGYLASGTISGTLLYSAGPDVGSQIELVNYSVVGDPPMAVENSVYTATTSATGEFVFNTPPALLPTEHYYLRYTNPTLAGPPEDYDVTRVSSWTSYDLPEYAYDMNVAFPDINVANVEMNQNAGNVPVPYQFSWGRRVGDPTEEYDFVLTDQVSSFYASGPLGYVDHFDLIALPLGFVFDVQYIWGVHIISATAGEGYSFFLPVAFGLDLPGGLSAPTEAPAFQPLR